MVHFWISYNPRIKSLPWDDINNDKMLLVILSPLNRLFLDIETSLFHFNWTDWLTSTLQYYRNFKSVRPKRALYQNERSSSMSHGPWLIAWFKIFHFQSSLDQLKWIPWTFKFVTFMSSNKIRVCCWFTSFCSVNSFSRSSTRCRSLFAPVTNWKLFLVSTIVYGPYTMVYLGQYNNGRKDPYYNKYPKHVFF